MPSVTTDTVFIVTVDIVSNEGTDDSLSSDKVKVSGADDDPASNTEADSVSSAEDDPVSNAADDMVTDADFFVITGTLSAV